MKRIYKICIAVFLPLLLLVICFSFTQKKAYTYEQLYSMPPRQLYDLFIDNGLVINERLKQHFSDDEIADLLKLEFDKLSQGTIARNDIMYFDFADEVHRVFEQLTNQTN